MVSTKRVSLLQKFQYLHSLPFDNQGVTVVVLLLPVTSDSGLCLQMAKLRCILTILSESTSTACSDSSLTAGSNFLQAEEPKLAALTPLPALGGTKHCPMIDCALLQKNKKQVIRGLHDQLVLSFGAGYKYFSVQLLHRQQDYLPCYVATIFKWQNIARHQLTLNGTTKEYTKYKMRNPAVGTFTKMDTEDRSIGSI